MTIEQSSPGRVTPPSTTIENLEPTTTVADRPSGNMRARMWIGQNPVPFVVACLWSGYWIGRATGRR